MSTVWHVGGIYCHHFSIPIKDQQNINILLVTTCVMKYVCSTPEMNVAEIPYVSLTHLYVKSFFPFPQAWQNEGRSLRLLALFMLSTSIGSCFTSLFQLILNHDALSFQFFFSRRIVFPLPYNVTSSRRSYVYLSEEKQIWNFNRIIRNMLNRISIHRE